MRVLGKLRRKFCDAFRKGTPLILLRVPLMEMDFGQEIFHGLRLVGEETLIQVAGIPVKQHPTEVEDDSFDGGFHAGDCIRILIIAFVNAKSRTRQNRSSRFLRSVWLPRPGTAPYQGWKDRTATLLK